MSRGDIQGLRPCFALRVAGVAQGRSAAGGDTGQIWSRERSERTPRAAVAICAEGRGRRGQTRIQGRSGPPSRAAAAISAADRARQNTVEAAGVTSKCCDRDLRRASPAVAQDRFRAGACRGDLLGLRSRFAQRLAGGGIEESRRRGWRGRPPRVAVAMCAAGLEPAQDTVGAGGGRVTSMSCGRDLHRCGRDFRRGSSGAEQS